jgi:opine dehydrogenase
MRIAVLGAGPVGLGSAALLASRGHVPVIWSRSAVDVVTARGAIDTTFVPLVTRDCADAVMGADAVLVAVPATGYRAVLDVLARALRPGQPVLISGHLSFAALYLHRAAGVPVAAWGTTAVTGRRDGPGAVAVSSVRAEVDVAVLGGTDVLALCSHLFPQRFTLRDSLVAITLSNVNPQNHLAIALANFTRIEKGEHWRQNSHITESVGRLMEALDAERLAIAEAFGVSVRTLRRHFHLSFHVPEAPLDVMAAQLAAQGSDPVAPATTRTRYVLEDAPFGLYPVCVLGRICGRPAVLHESGLALLSAMYGRDLASDNDILPGLGLASMTQDQIAEVG